MLKKVLYFLLFALVANLNAQYSISIGTYHNIAQDMPINNEYEYNWSSTLYYHDEINVHGDITRLYYDGRLWGSFGPGTFLTLSNQRIFMRLTSDEELASAAFPDTNSMTLVYAGPVDFYDGAQTEIVLDVPFSYDNTSNLQILYINKSGYAETDSDLRIFTTKDNNSIVNRTVFKHDNGSLPSGEGTLTHQIPITYLRFSSGTDVGISAINHNINNVLAGPVDLTANFRNYMSDTINSLDIDWSLNGVPQTTIQWTGEVFPGQESEDILLESLDMAPGSYIVEATLSSPNGGSDEVPANNSQSLTIHAANYIEIGADDGSFQHAPLRTDMNYGWTSSLYAADSLGINGIIKGISYNLATNPYTLPDQKIFLTTNSRIDFWDGSYPDEEAMKQVFEGTVEFTGTGWNTIVFDSVFSYADAQNLQVFYQDRSNDPHTLATYFYKHNRVKSTIHHPNNTQFPAMSGLTYDAAPNIRFHFALPNDAGIAAIDAPYVTTSTGNQEVQVSLVNEGFTNLASVDINYQIDGGTVQTVNWTGSLAYAETQDNLSLAGHDFSYGAHHIKVWTSAPNGYNDYANENDTLEIDFFAGSPLSGTYVVGEAPSDFVTLREVFDSLNSPAGINGAVTFEIKPGTYSSQFSLGEVAGSNEDFSITFTSQTGDSTDVVVASDSTDYILRLDGTDNIGFHELTFMSDSAANYVEINHGANQVVFTGNQFLGKTSTQNLVISPAEAGSIDSHNTFNQNYFEGAGNGLSLNSESGIYEEGNLVVNNRFENQTSASTNFSYQQGLLFQENRVSNESAYGIVMSEVSGALITRNRVESGGVYQAPVRIRSIGDTSYITNNFFICHETNNGGILLRGSNGVFAYNSVVSSGTSGLHASLDIMDNNKMVYNNILVNTGYGNAIKVNMWSENISSDYNCLFAASGPIGQWGNTDTELLADWQTASGQDANSIAILPAFVSETNLHTVSYSLDGAGTPLDYVSVDIDNESRDALQPDIGADEFDSPCSGPLAGEYSIGASGNYTSFNEAILALKSCGVSGSVTFSVQGGSYNEQVVIDDMIEGYTDMDTIIFESASADSTSVILTYAANEASNYTLKLDGADRIVFRGITLQAEDPNFGNVIDINNGAHNNRFENNRVIGFDTDTISRNHTLIYSPYFGAIDSANVFKNNLMLDGSYGFYYMGYDGGYGGYENATQIIGNHLIGQSTEGINVGFQKGILIINNQISMADGLYYMYGIEFDQDNPAPQIFGNRVLIETEGRAIGMYLSHTDSALIANNFIAVSSGYQASCISYLGNGAKCYFNSMLTFNSQSSSVIDQFSGNPSEIKNNSIVNLAGGLAVLYYGTPTLEMDYNNLYSNGEYIGQANSLSITSLAQWKAESGFDSHSVSTDPVYKSSSDLHTNHILLNGSGTPVAEVSFDIDGELRNATNPDIGADEFDNPVFELPETIRFCIDETAVINAGIGFDSYSWTTGSDSSSIVLDSTGIGYGEQEIGVTVTLGGMEYSDSTLVIFSSPIAMSINDYCINAYEDSILVIAGEGASYAWSSGETTQALYVSEGVYFVTVSDAHGCADIGDVTVMNNQCPANIQATEGTVLYSNETLQLSADQCGENYYASDYLWSTGDTTYTITLNGADYDEGKHDFVVTIMSTSELDCESTDTISIEVQLASGLPLKNENSQINIYPNPASDVFFVEGENIQQVEAYNMQGNRIYQAGIPGKVAVDLSMHPKGAYLLKVILPDQCLTTTIVLE